MDKLFKTLADIFLQASKQSVRLSSGKQLCHTCDHYKVLVVDDLISHAKRELVRKLYMFDSRSGKELAVYINRCNLFIIMLKAFIYRLLAK